MRRDWRSSNSLTFTSVLGQAHRFVTGIVNRAVGAGGCGAALRVFRLTLWRVCRSPGREDSGAVFHSGINSEFRRLRSELTSAPPKMAIVDLFSAPRSLARLTTTAAVEDPVLDIFH